MDFDYFVEGPLLQIVFYVFIIGVLFRIAFFFYSIIRCGKGKDFKSLFFLKNIALSFFPLHKVVIKRPVYVTLRYLFHACMIIVPIWFSGHIVLWEESRFEWYWTAIPDDWADWMTILLLLLAAYFLIRRIILSNIRTVSSISDYILIILAALPFLTGYLLTHGTLESMSFFENNMLTIHILSGETFIIVAVFLFCRTRLNTEKCITCGACDISCPTGTLEARDEGGMRIFTYCHYQCICCGACINTCPEEAAELRHEISLARFFQIASKQEIRSAKLKACERCGILYVPEPQLEKISQTYAFDYTRFCPGCRKINIGEVLRQLSPWHRPKKSKSSVV
jgi:Pyruvate/2-oxoacid:ferredoxin oxidoreductase delta subunit/nitrate reductase gamma subunit